MADAPLVSIVTPTLNARRYLDQCVQSVLGQGYPHIEQVFVDGDSTDGTLEALRAYEARRPDRVRLILKPGAGPGAAWNIGLKAARGDIFGCLGADDLCAPGAIEAVVAFFREQPGASFVHGGCDFIDAGGRLLRPHRVEPFDYRTFANTARHIATPSAFYRRSVMERVGWLDASGDDFDLMLRIAREFEIHGLDRVLSCLRIHDGTAFNPRHFGRRVAVYRQTYQTSRRHGGSLLSPLAVRYYVAMTLARCGLKVCYPLLQRAVRRLRRLPTAS